MMRSTEMNQKRMLLCVTAASMAVVVVGCAAHPMGTVARPHDDVAPVADAAAGPDSLDAAMTTAHVPDQTK